MLVGTMINALGLTAPLPFTKILMGPVTAVAGMLVRSISVSETAALVLVVDVALLENLTLSEVGGRSPGQKPLPMILIIAGSPCPTKGGSTSVIVWALRRMAPARRKRHAAVPKTLLKFMAILQ